MSKRTKLSETSARIPDTRAGHWDAAITAYLRDIEPMNKEAARSIRFAMLTQELLGREPEFIENYAKGVESYLKTSKKDRILKGEADNLFGNIIIEFESSLPRKLDEAQRQLKQYTAILWSEELPETRTPYICIATDGVRFYTYTPMLVDPKIRQVRPEDVHLEEIEKAEWTALKPTEVFYWLDRYFLRKEILHPTSERIVKDFGVKSHAFQTTSNALLALWRLVKSDNAFDVIYDSWEKYLLIVYGSRVAGNELFVRHTYLATLAKLMSWMRITGESTLPDDSQIIEMLEGRLFQAQGIENFIEEDFFSWLARGEAAPTAVSVVRGLFSLLQNYNLRELSEDVLKSLYQELVDPEARHDLGEFYTPDWLAHRIVRKMLDAKPNGSVLDPACGSGTFLYLAIHEKRSRLGDSPQTLSHVLNAVYGSDIHPLAVIVAKTNYILALGDLLQKRRGSVTIPIYLADTLRLPEWDPKTTLWMTLPSYKVRLEDKEIYIPELLLNDLGLYDQSIELAREFAHQNKGKATTLGQFLNLLYARRFRESANEFLCKSLYDVAETLKHFIDIGRDTIWTFVLKNIYKPLFFKRKFDFVVGNPPWIALRFMEPAYQAFLKDQVTEEYRLLQGRGELITHLEVATLFLLRAADLYLKGGGSIAFVLPRSLFSADQHDGLRKRTFRLVEEGKEKASEKATQKTIFWDEIWDCEDVEPLFGVPACVLIATKRQAVHLEEIGPKPVPGQILKGRLERKNASLSEAEEELAAEDVTFTLHRRGKRSFWGTGEDAGSSAASFYKAHFHQGATIVPRSFWFVRVKSSPLGFNPDLPPLESVVTSKAGPVQDYKDVKIEGNVEARFVYSTMLGDDLLPFGFRNVRTVVLPIEPAGETYRLLTTNDAHQKGFFGLERWLRRAEVEWTRIRGTKGKSTDLLDWLDYRNKLTDQHPGTTYHVLYPNFQRVSLAGIISTTDAFRFVLDNQGIAPAGFLVESALYYYMTNNLSNASYVCACLNSSLIDERLETLRRRGQKMHPNVHKKIFDVASIPQYEDLNPKHKRLADLGEACAEKVARWVAEESASNSKSIGRLRSAVRDMLRSELLEIDDLVHEILR